MQSCNKTGFLTDELRTAYLLASTESKELQRDEKAMQLLQEYASKSDLHNNTKDTNTYEVYSVDVEVSPRDGERKKKKKKNDRNLNDSSENNVEKHENKNDIYIYDDENQ